MVLIYKLEYFYISGAIMQRNQFRFLGIAILAIVMSFLQSCRTVDCGSEKVNNCDGNQKNADLLLANKRLWELELRNEFRDSISYFVIESSNPLVKKEANEAKNRNFLFTSPVMPTVSLHDGVYTVEVIFLNRKIFREYGDAVFNPESEYREKNRFTIKFPQLDSRFTPKNIFLLTSKADSDIKPIPDSLVVDEECYCCDRNRYCLNEKTGFLDKFEIRLMGAYRFGAQDSIFYPGPDGGKTYYKETFGFERGGTDFTAGLELSFLFNASSLFGFENMDRDNFQIGLMTGFYPVDGSIFIPITIHPRYTFDDEAWPRIFPKINDCDAWYIFADIGTVWAPFDDVPIICTSGNCDDVYAYMLGIGIGYDWWMTKCMDFSIDGGFRVTHFPLPENNFCAECTGLDGKNPFRTSNQLFLRLGLTF